MSGATSPGLGRAASHKLLRPGSKGVVKEARVPEWLGWSYTAAGWRSTLELLRLVGTLRGLDTAACVANLSHCPGCHPAYKGAVGLLGCFGGWVRFNETEAEFPLQQIYFRDHKSYYKLCKDIHSFLTVFLDRAGGLERL